MTELKRDSKAGSEISGNYNNPMYQRPENYESNDNNQSGTSCLDKMKSCYTNPETPCQNYLMMGLTAAAVVIIIFLFYSLFIKS